MLIIGYCRTKPSPTIGLVYSIYYSIEEAIENMMMIEASQRMLRINNQDELGGISPPLKRYLELEIRTLQNAPRDAEKLERLLKAKERQKEEDIDIESYTQRSKNAVVPS
jgi:hypothetical protein